MRYNKEFNVKSRAYFFVNDQEVKAIAFTGNGPMAKDESGKNIRGTLTSIQGYNLEGPREWVSITRADFPADATVTVKKWYGPDMVEFSTLETSKFQEPARIDPLDALFAQAN